MRAVTYIRHGGPEVLTVEDVPLPACHRKGILIEVEAISVEGGDLLDRSGNFVPLGPPPNILGRQAAGRVIEVGAEVSGIAVGQRVVAVRPNGSHAEYFAAPAKTAWLIPDELDSVHAAAIPIAFGTAHDALTYYAGLVGGETVLIQGGTGGVALAAIQLARLLGARLIVATGSSDSRLAQLTPFGLDVGINYRTTDVVSKAMELTEGKGFDIVLDMVGGDTMQSSLLSLGRGGRLVAVGQASRAPLQVDLANVYNKGLRVSGLKLDIASDRLRAAIDWLLQACATGRLKPVIDRSFALDEAAAAHAHVESRNAFGRVILLP